MRTMKMQFLVLLYFFVTLAQINSERYLGNSEVTEGQHFFIECTDLRSAGVNQGDLVQWSKNNKSIDNFETGMVTISKFNARSSRLVIQNATKEDEGEYRCLKNGASSWFVTVNSEPRRIIEKTVYIRLEEPWHIICEDLPSEKNVNWMKNDKSIEKLSSGQIRVKRSSKGQSALYSESAAKEHEGTYTCMSEGTIYFLEIKKAKYTGTKIVWKNDPWYIECDDLQPEEEIYWTKDNHVIEELTSGEIKITKAHFKNSKIQASNAKIEHSGMYKCTKGSKDAFSLKILDVNYNGPKDNLEGKPWGILCNTKRGDRIAWSRNGEKIRQLETGEIEAINLRNGSSILQSRSARVEHEGDYKCTQSSGNFFHLSIQKAKEMKILKWNTSLNLECLHASKNDKIRWHKDGILMKNTDDKMLNISAKSDQVYGLYTCDAENNTQIWSYFQVVPPPTVHIPQAGTVIAGEDFQTTCSVNFWPELQIKWEFANKTYSASENNVKITRDEILGIDNAVFTIENVQNIGKNQLKCMASFDWNEKNGYIGESTMNLLVSPY